MKQTWVFASNNAHKLDEVRQILGDWVEILSLKDINCNVNPEETGANFEENALLKCEAVSDYTKFPILADDSGLCVKALNGLPGVRSARYAGENAGDMDNVRKLLTDMSGFSDRSASFTACLCLLKPNKIPLYYYGVINGTILSEPRGLGGFGYDPVFVPEGYDQSFAELGPEVKNNISHRRLALNYLVAQTFKTP